MRWRLPAVLGLAAVTIAAALVVGDYPIAVSRVAEALRGIGSPRIRYVVLDLRLPRALVATVGGAALGLAGAVLQRLARNPLASPDVIGISAGAGLGAVGALVLVAAGPAGVVGGAAGGALLAAVTVYRLSSRHGVTGPRLVLVGIAVGAVASALTSWLLTTADLYVAERPPCGWSAASPGGRGPTPCRWSWRCPC